MEETKQQNYTILEGYELPSKGLIYDKQINPYVELRSMTARDEMKRQNPGGILPFKLLADIIEGCMIEKPAIHVYDMALGDYEFLLHKLRIVTYGDEYNLGIKCPYCGEAIETMAHLNDLTVKEFNIDDINSLRTFTLPKSGKLVTINFQTPHILDDIDVRVKEMKRRFKNAEIDWSTLTTIMAAIDSVDGTKLTGVELETFINNLPAMDMLKILNNIDKLNRSIGIDTQIYVTCDKCNEEVQTFFRFGQEFFRPSNI